MKTRTIRTPERFLEVSPIEVPGENNGKLYVENFFLATSPSIIQGSERYYVHNVEQLTVCFLRIV